MFPNDICTDNDVFSFSSALGLVVDFSTTFLRNLTLSVVTVLQRTISYSQCFRKDSYLRTTEALTLPEVSLVGIARWMYTLLRNVRKHPACFLNVLRLGAILNLNKIRATRQSHLYNLYFYFSKRKEIIMMDVLSVVNHK
jgi:hypothetical protein